MVLKESDAHFITDALDYKGNVANDLANAFYTSHGVKDITPAFELKPIDDATVMFCKHCIKFAMGWCSKNGVKTPYAEPFFLVSGDGRRFRLKFDCKACQMHVIAEK